LLKEKGYSFRNIAAAINRSVSTVSDEIKRNRVNGRYDPNKAHHKAYVRRQQSKYQGMHIVKDKEMKKFVDAGLLDDLSPEAIAGRLTAKEKDLVGISKDSIYRYVKSVYGRKIEAHRKHKRQRRRKRIVIHPSISDRVFIDKRPSNINMRRHVGDCEGDFVVSGKDGSGVLLVVVDRRIRTTFLELIPVVGIEAVHNAFVRIKERFPEMKSLTLDNDILFRKHQELSTLLGMPIYFCHPYHSWEKGTVENVNKYIRRDIRKGTNLSKIDPSFIVSLEQKLNRRPMKCLGYATPQERLDAYRHKKKHQRASFWF
jgi:IS30 family transposase